jgi:integrase
MVDGTGRQHHHSAAAFRFRLLIDPMPIRYPWPAMTDEARTDIARFLAREATRGISASTLRYYRSDLDEVAQFKDGAALEAHLSTRAPNTIRRRFQTWNRFRRFIDPSHAVHQPALDRSAPPRKRRIQTTPEMIEALSRRPRKGRNAQRDLLLLRQQAVTGATPGELSRMRNGARRPMFASASGKPLGERRIRAIFERARLLAERAVTNR